ncbi:reverse transcriptase domain-containing protein [Tanacetum coccineum]
MTRISRTITVAGKPFNIEHKLNEYKHIKLVKQKKRGLGPDRNEAACKELEDLMKAGILQKVKDKTWVANPAMVKKSDRDWRMYIDFTDINKACPKDCYPLPEIDWKVESLSGLLRMRRTILLSKDDFRFEECRRHLPKSTSEEDMIKDIQETFDRLLSVNMKFNLKKCSFGEEGPFLGHFITKQGIKANPLKVKAVTDLKTPKMLKDIQSLNRKLAALSRFLSKGAEKSLPLFKALKSYTDKKTIQWTTDVEEAFQKLKKFMEILPTLTAPIKGEVLVIYHATSTKSISVVLLIKRGEEQVHIYFVSRVLQGAELNYPGLEKLILVLVHTARRL